MTICLVGLVVVAPVPDIGRTRQSPDALAALPGGRFGLRILATAIPRPVSCPPCPDHDVAEVGAFDAAYGNGAVVAVRARHIARDGLCTNLIRQVESGFLVDIGVAAAFAAFGRIKSRQANA